jgi:hypothetical protein
MRSDSILPKEFNVLTRFKNNRNLSAEKLSYYGVAYFIVYAAKDFNLAQKDWQLYRQLDNGIRIYKNLRFLGRSYVANENGRMLRGAQILKNTGTAVFMRARAVKGEVLILADSWFPGWKCYDNGRLVAGFDADGLRGYRIQESGLHEVKWVYDPFSVRLGIYISLAVFILFFIRLAGVFKKGKRRILPQ